MTGRLQTWIATCVLLTAAGVVSAIAPADDAEVAPFVVRGEIAEPVEGRDLIATVTDAHTTGTVTGKVNYKGRTTWSADANWLVVDVDVESRTGPRLTTLTGGVALMHAVVEYEGREYGATERVSSLLVTRLNPGVPIHGQLAFELPAITGTGVLKLALSSDTRMDSLLEIPIDLATLDAVAEIQITSPGWAS